MKISTQAASKDPTKDHPVKNHPTKKFGQLTDEEKTFGDDWDEPPKYPMISTVCEPVKVCKPAKVREPIRVCEPVKICKPVKISESINVTQQRTAEESVREEKTAEQRDEQHGEQKKKKTENWMPDLDEAGDSIPSSQMEGKEGSVICEQAPRYSFVGSLLGEIGKDLIELHLTRLRLDCGLSISFNFI